MKEEPHVHVLNLDAIPLHVWEAWAEETAKFIRRILRDPEIRAEIAPEMDKDMKGQKEEEQ